MVSFLADLGRLFPAFTRPVPPAGGRQLEMSAGGGKAVAGAVVNADRRRGGRKVAEIGDAAGPLRRPPPAGELLPTALSCNSISIYMASNLE